MTDETKDIYTAITFAPVQGFIEKSRKLRDLYGASLILSYLSQQIVIAGHKPPETTVISPANISVQKGMPNRILIKGHFPEDTARQELLTAWEDILFVCRNWIETKLPNYKYEWKREWGHWGNHTWEIFWGQGNSIANAMEDLETRKLSRNWTAINWIGESSSLTGTDGIAFPGLGGENRNPKNLTYRCEQGDITTFYQDLAYITENQDNSQEEEPETEELEEELQGEEKNISKKSEPEGKFIALNEQLSIPELVKRLVTCEDVRKDIGIEIGGDNFSFGQLPQGFKEIRRKPTENQPGQWTGWFMGDGDEVGKKLKKLANSEKAKENLRELTIELRNWGKDFYRHLPKQKLGRVIYAGGDDFLGVIYSKNVRKPIPGLTALEWLMTLNNKWHEHKQDINVSVGFVWVAGSVPQRDVLQHCRQAQDTAKSLKRDRVTIRIVFNSGQYVEWTCPWKYLHILKEYTDRKGNTYPEWESRGRDSKHEPNWTHIYSDLAQLKARHAFGLAENRRRQEIDSNNTAKQSKILDYRQDFLEFFDIYFPGYKDILKSHEKLLVGASDDANSAQTALLMINWIENLITIGWHLCSNTNTSSSLDH
ncbi:type III-B CRISPR-associated protein Cas10/Cmr2 [Cronbergia sp. UHCC 0137]|uniref:Cas10/Cmr2 second palm domain-containing protein n=1 Tax=Cronbergia sp. UHCC 0137 TaxID=3110239 RepID=UPI002B20BCBA|nr:type III-B CRISPR-associated protein Cas10/Cmr2 [Cronbergia sp. UHCC 0137]MEA5620466.1 type III-B CRISPR-associated protein Cas10/Cmr2 [Cronbergia sp. UHCC 0137]